MALSKIAINTKKINANDFYVDASKVGPIVTALQSAYSGLATSTSKINDLFKNLIKSNVVSGDLLDPVRKTRKALVDQTSTIKKHAKTLKSKYAADVQDHAIKSLTDSYAKLFADYQALLKRVETLEKVQL